MIGLATFSDRNIEREANCNQDIYSRLITDGYNVYKRNLDVDENVEYFSLFLFLYFFVRGSGWMKFLMLTDIFIRELSFVFKFQLTIVADVSATS